MRTGDLGFIADGELFVSGRIKDLIVIRGVNHYPQDIEETVAKLHDAFRQNTTAACSMLIEESERLFIFQEITGRSRELDIVELTRLVRRAISERHQLEVSEIIFLRSGALPRTTSGKIRRHACLRHYLQGTLLRWNPTS